MAEGASDLASDLAITHDATTHDATTHDATTHDATTTGTDAAAGSAGCHLPLASGISDVSIVVDGVTRTYVRVVPSSYDPAKPYPLFIGLHASGGTAQSGRSKLNLEAGSHEPAVFVYPNGTPGASPSGDRGWVLDGDGADVAFYDALLAELTNTACIDRARVAVVGFSNGGMFANVLACLRAADLRMVVSVASTPGPTSCQPDHVALLLAAGELDNLVPLTTSQQVRDEAAARNGCAAPGAAQPALPCPANTTCSCAEYTGCLSGYPLT